MSYVDSNFEVSDESIQAKVESFASRFRGVGPLFTGSFISKALYASRRKVISDFGFLRALVLWPFLPIRPRHRFIPGPLFLSLRFGGDLHQCRPVLSSGMKAWSVSCRSPNDVIL